MSLINILCKHHDLRARGHVCVAAYCEEPITVAATTVLSVGFIAPRIALRLDSGPPDGETCCTDRSSLRLHPPGERDRWIKACMHDTGDTIDD